LSQKFVEKRKQWVVKVLSIRFLWEIWDIGVGELKPLQELVTAMKNGWHWIFQMCSSFLESRRCFVELAGIIIYLNIQHDQELTSILYNFLQL
jgi:hypothetical protein